MQAVNGQLGLKRVHFKWKKSWMLRGGVSRSAQGKDPAWFFMKGGRRGDHKADGTIWRWWPGAQQTTPRTLTKVLLCNLCTNHGPGPMLWARLMGLGPCIFTHPSCWMSWAAALLLASLSSLCWCPDLCLLWVRQLIWSPTLPEGVSSHSLSMKKNELWTKPFYTGPRG